MINQFRGKYDFLSNFYLCTVPYDGLIFPSVEHAFQAAKSENFDLRRNLLDSCVTAREAKKFGQSIELRGRWDEIKISIMSELLFLKFIYAPPLREKLKATGEELLVEGNWWEDNFWGCCPIPSDEYTYYNHKISCNNLGKLLMQIRELL